MSTRPLQFAPEHAAAFEDADVVAEYRYRAPYAPRTFDVLLRLMDPSAHTVLDLGAGTGPIARKLAPHVDRVDAIDPSAAMIAAGRALPQGQDPRLRWVLGRAEDAPLDPPYGLVTAGASIHWMDWEHVLPRTAKALTPHGHLAIVEVDDRHAPWQTELVRLFEEYSVYRHEYREIDIVAELEQRGLFRSAGRERIPSEFAQPLDDYVRAFHSHSSLSRARIGRKRAAEFDDKVRKIAIAKDGAVYRRTETTIVWGRPP